MSRGGAGIRCQCGSYRTIVTDSRGTAPDKDNYVRRRYRCLDCETRFTTYERVDSHDRINTIEALLKASEAIRAATTKLVEIELERRIAGGIEF